MVAVNGAEAVARWSIGGAFLERLASRQFEQLGETLDESVRFRALLPPGPMEWNGASAVVDTFRSWFGDAEDFEVVDAAVGGVGPRIHLSWRVRVRPAPFGIGAGWHLIEQQAYADALDAIEVLDLVCSGFNAEPSPAAG